MGESRSCDQHIIGKRGLRQRAQKQEEEECETSFCTLLDLGRRMKIVPSLWPREHMDQDNLQLGILGTGDPMQRLPWALHGCGSALSPAGERPYSGKGQELRMPAERASWAGRRVL
jgi:hypothetical protein